MKKIDLTDVLVYYDGVQVFAGRDSGGGQYIGVGIGPEVTTNRYLVTGATSERLGQFRSGRVDLRTLLLEAPGGRWYLTTDEGGDAPLTLLPQDEDIAQCDYLPGPDFVLRAEPGDSFTQGQGPESGYNGLEFSAAPAKAGKGRPAARR